MYGELQKINKIIECFIPGDWGEESSLPNAENQYFCIRGADINAVNQGKFDKIPLRCTSFKSLQNKKLKKGDIVIEKSGGSPVQSTGRTCFISQELIESHLYVLCSNFCVAIRCKTDWNSKYVFYFLNYIYDQGVFFNFEGKTSGLKNLQIEAAFDSIKIPVIQRKKQDQIAYVLDAIEKRICNLRKQNSVMEQIAKNIYDYTFLQCAGHQTTYNKTLNRNIPTNWEVSTIGCYIKESKGGDWGKENPEKNYNLQVSCIRGADIEKMTDLPIRYILAKNSSKLLQEFDLVVEISGGSPTQSTGRSRLITKELLEIFDQKLICSNFCQAVTLKNSLYAYYFYFMWKKFYDEGIFFNFEGKTSGIKNFQLDQFLDTKWFFPDLQTVKKFNAQVSPLIQKQLLNAKQIETLTTQRNTLLPLLMTGQVEV